MRISQERKINEYIAGTETPKLTEDQQKRLEEAVCRGIIKGFNSGFAEYALKKGLYDYGLHS